MLHQLIETVYPNLDRVKCPTKFCIYTYTYTSYIIRLISADALISYISYNHFILLKVGCNMNRVKLTTLYVLLQNGLYVLLAENVLFFHLFTSQIFCFQEF